MNQATHLRPFATAKLLHGLVIGVLLIVQAIPVKAQYDDPMSFSALRSPLIPGAQWNEPYTAPEPGQSPPPGQGMCPAPVTPGHIGPPPKPPSAVELPPVGPLEKGTVNALVAPYLKPPQSTAGEDPGLLHGPNGFSPPAAVVNVSPQGGIYGEAPIRRWGGQTSRDLGVPRTFGSQTTDFGQDIDGLSSVQSRGIRRLVSEDGPRPQPYSIQMGTGTTRQANLAGAHTTQDLHGNRQLFKGANLRSLMTIAPY
ncbi:MAG: hypothetical protein HY711_07510 [Candidatus Melainabacteria bacterium]|nr:hypothetical protein [Candidatus Melainabacteria bacterium]